MSGIVGGALKAAIAARRTALEAAGMDSTTAAIAAKADVAAPTGTAIVPYQPQPTGDLPPLQPVAKGPGFVSAPLLIATAAIVTVLLLAK